MHCLFHDENSQDMLSKFILIPYFFSTNSTAYESDKKAFLLQHLGPPISLILLITDDVNSILSL